jgi:hypothetical protein
LRPDHQGRKAGIRLVLTTDFYDFGVPVTVSAPSASQIAPEGSRFAVGWGEINGSGSGEIPASGS